MRQRAGVVDRLGDGASGVEPGEIVAALPISGAYTEFICLPQRELVPVPSGLDHAEAVSIWLSRKALRRGGTVVAYGRTGSLRGGRLASRRSGGRHRYRAIAIFGVYILAGLVLPGRKRVVPYSIQTLKRLRPELFREDLIALFDLLKQQKIKPLIARRFPLAEARQAHELLGAGGVAGKIVLLPAHL